MKLQKTLLMLAFIALSTIWLTTAGCMQQGTTQTTLSEDVLSELLMEEHRLIERMIELAKKEALNISKNNVINPAFIDKFVDFIRTYADKTHHGKEENILFRELAKKKMSQENQEMMYDLIEEHKFGRKTVGELVSAKEKHLKGDKKALQAVLEKLNVLIEFYPKHIEKEELEFFPSTEEYFSREELKLMLTEFWEFDRKMIHEKYKSVVEKLEGNS